MTSPRNTSFSGIPHSYYSLPKGLKPAEVTPAAVIHETHQSLLDHTPCALNIADETFKEMVMRKIRRRVGGKYGKSSTSRNSAIIFFLLVFTGVSALTFQHTENGSNLVINLHIRTGSIVSTVMLLLLSLFVVYAIFKLVKLIRWCLYWAILAVLILIGVTRNPIAALSLVGSFCSQGSTVDPIKCPNSSYPCLIVNDHQVQCVASQFDTQRTVIFIVLIIFEVLTVLVWLFNQYLMADVVSRRFAAIEKFMKLQRVPGKTNTFTYKRFGIFGKPCVCKYIGHRNKNGKPHGWGEWSDESPGGEVLYGYWNDGIPTGPFVSREVRSGYVFRSVRIGFILARDDAWNSRSWKPRCATDPCVGVASVECSVVGKFFRSFPASQLITCNKLSKLSPPKRTNGEGCTNWVLQLLASMPHMNETELCQSVVVSTHQDKSLVVSGHIPFDSQNNSTIRISAQPASRQQQQQQQQQQGDDAASTVSSSSTTGGGGGTFVTPETKNDVVLHIDGWISSLHQSMEALVFIPGYNCTLQHSLDRLGQLLCLGDYPAHLKPFIFSWPAGQLFSYHQAISKGAMGQLTVKAFLDMVYELQSAGFRTLHIMVHSAGARVFFNVMDQLCDMLSGGEQHSNTQTLSLGNVVLLNPDYPRDAFLNDCFVRLSEVCCNITLYGDENDGALGWAEKLNRSRPNGECIGSNTPSLGKSVFMMKNTNNMWLDMDVIDTTWMESNVHSIRHMYFNLNREMIEDLLDLLITRRRAKYRSRLQRREGNVYSFMAAPSFVVND